MLQQKQLALFIVAIIVALLIGYYVGYDIGYEKGGSAMHLMMDGGGGGHDHAQMTGTESGTSVKDALKNLDAAR